MTSVLKEDDKIFTMYKQYKELIYQDAEKHGNFVYGVDQMASRLVVAHMFDHVVCLIKEDKPSTTKEIKKGPQTLLETFSVPKKSFITGTATDDGEIDWKRTE